MICAMSMTRMNSDAPADVCQALGLSRATFYRTLSGDSSTAVETSQVLPRASCRSLTASERDDVLGILHSERFADLSPTQSSLFSQPSATPPATAIDRRTEDGEALIPVAQH